MSDVDMDTSPRSSTTSDVENPPTPDYGKHDDSDDDHDEAIEKEEKEQASVKSKSPNDSEHDGSDEEGVVSHKGSLSDEQEDQVDESHETAGLEADSDNVSEAESPSPKDESPKQQKSDDIEEDEPKQDAVSNVVKSDDTTLTENSEKKAKDNDVASEAEESETKEMKEEPAKGEENVDRGLQESESLPKTGSGNVDDGDLLQISDLSVDLTGDEAAIVEDILQSAGDGELIPSGNTADEKQLLEDKEEMPDSSKEASAEVAKEQQSQEEQGGGTGELFADIFGSSDEDEEFEGFEKDELHGSSKSKKKLPKEKHRKRLIIASDEEDEPVKIETETAVVDAGVEVEVDVKNEAEAETEEPNESLEVPPPAAESSGSEDDDGQPEIFVSDFDQMMEQKKEENRKVRRRKNVDIINDSDDMVVGLIRRMQDAAQDDRVANEARQAATKKLLLLPAVMKHMLKIDLMVVFLDCNVLPVLRDWLIPLPDGSLPHLQIREGVLNILKQLPRVDSGALKVSGIGKAVMYLFRHPKETRKNKECAGKLISEWSRPIFGVTANFKSMSREEREERDYENMSKRRRLSSDGGESEQTPKKIENAIQSESKSLRPGEKGWCMRARVPAPSNKDYVVRPKSNIDFVDFTKTSKKTMNRFEKQKRKFNDKKSVTGKQRAVDISLEGRKMSL